ncbi:MAG TPA: hypothetical protein VHG28_01540 [Longimicrobiaceae bacterium]|nr:hypothetical protein [Longimicrobiaceae bacterium]
MDLDQFLDAGGADLPALVAKVDSTIGLRPDDFLLVIGSLVEGLGTSRSDLDLLLITPRPDHLLPEEDEIALVVGRCLADVRVLPLAELEKLLARLDRWSSEPWAVSHATRFTLQERVLLHRLLHGRLILHSERSDPAAVPRPAEETVARLKLHVARHLSRTVQVDMAGHRDAGDPASLVFAAQDLLGHAVDALTAGHGLTNPNPKWRSRLLEWVPADWEAALGIRPSGRSAAELVWQLHRAPERPEMGAALEHALRITAFARAVFVWAERRLVRASAVDADPPSWPRLERHPTDTLLPHLDLDVDFLLADGGALVARLNSFGTPLRLSPPEFALALLFDGVTTAREAEVVVCGTDSRVPGTGPAHELVSRIMATNLSAP